MCLNPLYLPTQSKKIYRNMHHKLINCVPCGKCFECQVDKTNELMVRSYYETIDSKWCLFDTLTYDENNVKWFNGIRVLDYSDYQKFVKRIRKQLTKLNVEFSYIVSGEYGTKETATHRPHYHFILFIKNDNIKPIELSKMISDNWHYGRTDGVKYNNEYYVMGQRVFNGITAQKNVVGYVCKYMTKIAKYDEKIREVINIRVRNELESSNVLKDYKILFNEYYKNIKQFVKWSKGFGDRFIKDENEISNYESNLYIQIPTDLKFKKYKLPQYYRRKIFMEIDSKTNTYRLNKRGFELKNRFMIKMVDIMENNLKLYYYLFDDEHKQSIDRIGARNIANYSVYDRGIYDEGIYKFDYETFYELQNTKNDRMNYEHGLININGEKKTAKEWIERNSIADSEIDEILNLLTKYILCEKEKVAKSKEIIHEYKRLN